MSESNILESTETNDSTKTADELPVMVVAEVNDNGQSPLEWLSEVSKIESERSSTTDKEEMSIDDIIAQTESLVNQDEEDNSDETQTSSFESARQNILSTLQDISLEEVSNNIESSDDDLDDDDDDFEYPEASEVQPIPLWAVDDLTFGEEGDSASKVRRNVLDVKVPRNMLTNVPTGHYYIDRLATGSGITPSSAILVTGVPGSGKSTMMIEAADCITATGNIAVYNSNEESDIQLSRVVSRLRLKNGFEITNFKSVFEVVAHVRKIQEQAYEVYFKDFNALKESGATAKKLMNLRPKQVFLILDSLQTLEMEHWCYDQKTGAVLLAKNGEPIKQAGAAPKGDNMYLNIARYLSYSWCKTTFGNMFLIGQVTKSGQFAGKQGIKHYVDAHLHLDIDTDKKSDTYGERVAEMTKNRFGIAGTLYPFNIEARGIRFKDPKKSL